MHHVDLDAVIPILSVLTMANFECEATPREGVKQLPPNNHVLEAIRFRLSTFNLPHAVTEKLLDILLVYGEGFHRRLFDILQQCDEQQKPKRSEIVHRLLTRRTKTRETDSDVDSAVKHEDITCKLALSIWTLFLQIVQHCLLSHSASGRLSATDRSPETEMECVIHEFVSMSKSAEMAATTTKEQLNAEIAECKDTLSALLQQHGDALSVQSQHRQQIKDLQHSVHEQSVSCSTLKEKVAAAQSAKAELEREASYLKKGSELIQIRSDQLYKKRMELKEQNDRLQSATDHLRHKVAFYTEECGGYRLQHDRATALCRQHRVDVAAKREQLEALKASYWILQRDNLEFGRQRIKTEATTAQFESRRGHLEEKREVELSALQQLDAVIAEQEEVQNEGVVRLEALQSAMADIAVQHSAATEKATGMRLELDSKCAALKEAQSELDDGAQRLSSMQSEIEALKMRESALTAECEVKREDVRSEQDDRDRFTWIYKEKLAELNGVEAVMVGHSKRVHVAEAEIGALRSDIAAMDAVSSSMRCEFGRQETYIAAATARREDDIERRRDKVERLQEDVAEHKVALNAVNGALFESEKTYTDALTVFHVEKRHLRALRAAKMRYGVQYGQLLEDHQKLERAIGGHDRMMMELDRKMQQQLIDTNEWKSRIYALTTEFDRTIKLRCAQIEAVRTRQCQLGETIIARDRELVAIRRRNQLEIAAVQKRNGAELVALESELEALSGRPFVSNARPPPDDDSGRGGGGGEEHFANDEMALSERKESVAMMKRAIENKTRKHRENEAVCVVLKDRHRDLSEDWKTTRLCKEHLTKELAELNEYEAQLLQKLQSLQKQLAVSTQIPRGTKSVAVGGGNE